MILITLLETAFVLAVAAEGAAAISTDLQRWHGNRQTTNLASVGSTTGATDSWTFSKQFQTTDCSGTPTVFVASPECTPSDMDGKCALNDYTSSSGSSSFEAPQWYLEYLCGDNVSTVLSDLYDDTPYLRIDFYDDANCTELGVINAMVADGECYNTLNGSYFHRDPASWMVTVNSNGSIVYSYFSEYDCVDLSSERLFGEDKLQSGKCFDGQIASTNLVRTSESSASAGSDSSSGTNKKFAIGYFAFFAAVLALVL